MSPEKWNRIKAVFTEAREIEPEKRPEFLDSVCGDDEVIRNEVQRLLDTYREDDPLMQNSAAEVLSIFEAQQTEKIDFVTSDTSSKGFEPGTLFNGRYEITHLLGKGGMGEVYHAIDTRIKRNVALKVLHSDHVSSKEGLRRFALEAQAVSALNHPHIMTVYEFETTAEGTLFIVAEYIDGKTLNEHLSGGRLDAGRALEIALQVSSALSAAHDAGITHRDIKPENIMVRRDGYIKVLDFGLAKLTADPNSTGPGSEDPTQALHKTKPGAVMGTAAYMSPEQARGLNVDARTDVWSLGVVTYEMLAGHRPFWGETSTDIIVSVLQRDPPPLVFYVEDLDPELESIVGKALAKKADERYQTSSELRADLEKVKKRIEYDHDLGRPTNQDSTRKFDNNEIKTALEDGTPTAGDVAETTSGGTAGSAASWSFWPFRSSASLNGPTQNRSIGLALGTIALIALVAYGIYDVISGSRTGHAIDSIAVLPFENLTGDPGLTYASEGVSESLIDRLSQLPQLKVISRSSSFKFRGRDLDLNDVAAKLGARAIVTGNVAQLGDELLIRVDVVDASENKHLLGGQYRRKTGDLLNIQTEIAQLVTEQLRVKLTDLQSTRLANRDTVNSEAYRYYLGGLVELNGPDDVRGKALEYFEHAVQLDPNFAQAHAEIAWIYWQLAEGAGNPYELMPKARTAVDRALAIDPDLADAHVVFAGINEYEFDWTGAEREYQRAIELSPNLDLARNNYAFFLSTMGRQSEALAQLEQQSMRDPINLRMGLLQKAIVLTQGRNFDDALQVYQQAQAVEPGLDIPNFSLGYAYAGKGQYKEAAEYFKKSVEVLGGENKYSQALVYLAATYARIPEKRDEARGILKRIESMNEYVSPAVLAAVYSALDDNDRAMALLEQAYIKRDLLLRYIGVGYEYDGLRGDPRFNDLIKRMGLPQ